MTNDLVIVSKSEILKILEHSIEYYKTDQVEEILNKAQPVNSEPVGELRCDESTGDFYSVYWYKNAPSIGTKVYTSQPAIPEGYQLVPIEPTEAMLKAGCEAGIDMHVLLDDTPYATDRAVYKAMLEAAKKEGV